MHGTLIWYLFIKKNDLDYRIRLIVGSNVTLISLIGNNSFIRRTSHNPEDLESEVVETLPILYVG